MDLEYLENIAGSPLIDVGLEETIAARGAAGLQRLRAMTGGGMEELERTRIKSVFGRFLTNITSALRDFDLENPKSLGNNMKAMSTITPDQKKAVDKFHELYRRIVPSKTRAYQTRYGVLEPRRYDAPTVKELAEGVMDIVKRPLQLNPAIASNDPNRIITAYIRYFKEQYNKFMTDIRTMMPGMSPDKVHQVMSDVEPAYGHILNGVADVAKTPTDSSIPEEPPVEEPAAGTSAEPEDPNDPIGTSGMWKAPAGATPPVISPTEPPAEEPAPAPAPAPAAAPTSAAASMNLPPVSGTPGVPLYSFSEEANDYVRMLALIISTIIKTVQEDSSKAEPFFAKDASGQYVPLPTDWKQPPITKKEAIDPSSPTGHEPVDVIPKPGHKKVIGGTTGDDDEEEDTRNDIDYIEGEFLYNFHSKWRKNHVFALGMVPREGDPVYQPPAGSSKKPVSMHVIWSNHSRRNEIYVSHMDLNPDMTQAGTPQRAKIFMFWDDDVDSRTPSGKKWSVDKMVKEANPIGTNLYEAADSGLKASLIDPQKDSLFRALYAVAIRKTMEFKPKKKGGPELEYDKKTGIVTLQTTKGPKELKPEEISAYLNSADKKEAAQWKANLEYAGLDIDKFYQAHPELKDIASTAVNDPSKGKMGEIIWDSNGNIFVKQPGSKNKIGTFPLGKMEYWPEDVKKKLADKGYWKLFPSGPKGPPQAAGTPTAAPANPPKSPKPAKPSGSGVTTDAEGNTLVTVGGKELAKFDKAGNVTYKEGGVEKKLTPDQVKLTPEPFQTMLKKAGYSFPKGQPKNKVKFTDLPPEGGASPAAPVTEEFVNPFQRDNFFL